MEQGPNVAQGLQWLGGGVLAILAVFGAGNLILAIVKRYWGQKDKSAELHDTNEAARINSNVSLVTELLRRVEFLETTQKEQGEKLMTLTDTNARLDERNKALSKENVQLREDLREVKAESRERQGRIRELETMVIDLQNEARILSGQVAELLAIQHGEK